MTNLLANVRALSDAGNAAQARAAIAAAERQLALPAPAWRAIGDAWHIVGDTDAASVAHDLVNLLQVVLSGHDLPAAAVTQDSALLYIRAMIAAAAADGRIDPKEQEKIFGSLKQAGMEAGAEEFLAKELNSPATVELLMDCRSRFSD